MRDQDEICFTLQTGGDAQCDLLSDIENIEGSAYDDIITGSSADNRLEGGEGEDTLNGGLGADILVGGAGDDVFVIDSATGIGFDDLVVKDTIIGTTIQIPGGELVRLEQGDASALNQGDFVF